MKNSKMLKLILVISGLILVIFGLIPIFVGSIPHGSDLSTIANLFVLGVGIAVLACGLISGVFLSFSDFVMRSFALAETTAGIQVMQIVNREVYRSIFMALMWGMLALSAVLGSYAAMHLDTGAYAWVLGGTGLYLVGVLLVTFIVNVPMNNQLKAMDAQTADTAKYWRNIFVSRWVRWNYVRAMASGAAAGCYLVASLLLR